MSSEEKIIKNSFYSHLLKSINKCLGPILQTPFCLGFTSLVPCKLMYRMVYAFNYY